MYSEELSGWIKELQLVASDTGTSLDVTALDAYQASKWSPLGGQLAVALMGEMKGIWTLQADPVNGFGDLQPLFPAEGRFDRTTDPRWSPDAGHLVFRHIVYKGGYKYYISRMKSDGTGVVRLTEDMDGPMRKWPYRWCSNEQAP